MQRLFSNVLRCVHGRLQFIIMKDLNGFLTQRQMSLKDVCWYTTLESFISHVWDAFLADSVDTISASL